MMNVAIWNSVTVKSTDPTVAGSAQTHTLTKHRALEGLHFWLLGLFKATYVSHLLSFFGVQWCLLGQISIVVERGCEAMLCYHVTLYMSYHLVYIMSCCAGVHYAWSWQPQ